MNESMHEYMKVGIIHFMAYPATIKGEGPILETLRKIVVDDYFDAVEITWMKESAVRIQAKKMLDTAHPSLPGYGDLHPRFGFPRGENDVNELISFLKVLMDIGYLNKKKPPIVSFEVKPFADEDPDIVIANAKRTLNEAWVRLNLT